MHGAATASATASAASKTVDPAIWRRGEIQATGADYCIAGCHNCHAQIHELSEHYGGGYGVIHLWTIICLALGILGENEREYLLPEHKELALYGG